MAMLALSSRPLSSSSFLRSKPRALHLHRHLLPKPLGSASPLTPPTPRADPAPAPDADPTPLFLRPASHRVPRAALAAFHRRAAALVPPSAPHLHRHLRWLLADATADPSAATTSSSEGPALLRAPLEDLEALWLRHVRERTPFQYVVGNEHWRDLVVAVREGVLIPRPETEAIIDMVRAVEDFADGWWADLGTGSGAIAVALARELAGQGRVFATDVSEVAIDVARLNVQRYGVQVSPGDRVSFESFFPTNYCSLVLPTHRSD
jgi:release factor glutamine methyltransferase